MKIIRAYCNELERVVSIDEARAEFFSIEEEKRARFSFTCSDPICRHHNTLATKVTAVNYDKLCVQQERIKDEEKNKIVGVVAHFKRNAKYTHSTDCEWVLHELYESHAEKHDDENENDFKQRQLRMKLSHFVQIFIPDPKVLESEIDCIDSDINNDCDHINSDVKHENGKGAQIRKSSKTQTIYLSKLVDTWNEARQTLTSEEFKQLELVIKKNKTLKLKSYFKHVRYAIADKHEGVIFGGAMMVKRYKLGFKLSFFDKVNDLPVHVYCANQVMENYRHRGYIDEVLKGPKDYFNLYILSADLVTTMNDYTLEVNNLKNLHIVAIHKSK